MWRQPQHSLFLKPHVFSALHSYPSDLLDLRVEVVEAGFHHYKPRRVPLF
jgi:hypothetical protein